MPQAFQPIETDIGIISGRDAFHLDNIHFDCQGNIIELIGEISGDLCSRNERNLEWIKYSLIFSGVLGFRMVELDFMQYSGESSFNRVIKSKWLEAMRMEDSGEKVKPEHEHYTLITYDDVFDVISSSYRLIIE